MCLAVDADPLFTRQLFIRYRCPYAGTEHLGAAPRHRVEPRLAQRDERFTNAHLLDTGDVRDLDGGEGLDVDVREVRLEGPEHFRVIGEPRSHIESADDMK